MERGQEGADAREEGHDQVEVMGDCVRQLPLDGLAVFEHQRDVFDDQHRAVAGDAEDDFREHRMHVGMPVAEPRPEGLADVEDKHEHGPGIAQEAHHHCQVDDVFQGVDVQEVAQRAREEGAGAEGDDREVEGDPQAEAEVVVKARFAEAVGQHAERGVSPPEAHQRHGDEMQEEFQQRATRAPFREECGVDGLIVVFRFH